MQVRIGKYYLTLSVFKVFITFYLLCMCVCACTCTCACVCVRMYVFVCAHATANMEVKGQLGRIHSLHLPYGSEESHSGPQAGL